MADASEIETHAGACKIGGAEIMHGLGSRRGARGCDASGKPQAPGAFQLDIVPPSSY